MITSSLGIKPIKGGIPPIERRSMERTIIIILLEDDVR